MKAPITLVEFMNVYRTEEACRSALVQHRWPDGYCCPKCRARRAYLIESRGVFECISCGYQVSPTAGTIFHKTRTSLQKWFLAIYLLASTKKSPSAAELKRQLGVATQTAWTMRRKIISAMARRDGELMLWGLVELDETFIGGCKEGKRGRGAEGKTLVAVSAKQTPNGGFDMAHMQVIPDASIMSLTGVAKKTIGPGSCVLTDGWLGYNGLEKEGYSHWPEAQDKAKAKNASQILPWVHIIAGNFKRWVLDAFHGVSPKHLQAYLDEFCYRLNRRYQRTDLFRRILNRCSLYATPITYAELTAS